MKPATLALLLLFSVCGCGRQPSVNETTGTLHSARALLPARTAAASALAAPGADAAGEQPVLSTPSSISATQQVVERLAGPTGALDAAAAPRIEGVPVAEQMVRVTRVDRKRLLTEEPRRLPIAGAYPPPALREPVSFTSWSTGRPGVVRSGTNALPQRRPRE